MSDEENRPQDQETEEESEPASSKPTDPSASLTEGDPPIIIQDDGSGTTT